MSGHEKRNMAAPSHAVGFRQSRTQTKEQDTSSSGATWWSNKLSGLMGLPGPKSTLPHPPTLDEERQLYHERNQRFLEKANKVKARAQNVSIPPLGTTNSALLLRSVTSPAENAKTHRRLESIEEGDPDVFSSMNSQPAQHSLSNHFQILSEDAPPSVYGSSVWDQETDKDIYSPFSGQKNLYGVEQNQEEQRIARQLEAKLYQPLERDSNNATMIGLRKHEIFNEYMSTLQREREELLETQKADRKLPAKGDSCLKSIFSFFATVEVFLANIPLTIGAVGLSWVAMGTVWFKYMEETSDFCKPVHYHSTECVFSEYPGCFDCDTTEPTYRLALMFHYACSTFAALCCVLFVVKTIIAWRVVADELRNPTTSTPLGVVCIAIVCVAAGRGKIGEGIVVATSIFHFALAFWFLYTAVFQFSLWPDPGWFPNTVGLSYAAVKIYLYFPAVGLFFLICSVIFFFALFFVSVVRVALNTKIAAPVAWLVLSAPSITLYAMTLVAQPSASQEKLIENDKEDEMEYHEWMAKYYLPFQHFMMVLSLVGVLSAVSALSVRLESFAKKPFSPAHVAFCFPTLSHANAIQAYRGTVAAFSNFPPGGHFRTILYGYWMVFLFIGTAVNVIFTAKYIHHLPQWTGLDTSDEEEPPAPEHTFVHDLLNLTETHELLDQPFTSPAVLQANEAGALVRVRRDSADYRLHGPYVRTRKVPALGFDPTLTDEELKRERAELLNWVATNAPRRRHRTMSNPTFLQDSGPSVGVYGTFGGNARHQRSATTTNVPGV